MTSAIQLYIKNDLKRELKIRAASEGVSISEIVRYYLTNWKLGLFGQIELENKSNLPPVSGIYFIISSNKVEYVGRSQNLRTRFYNHHRQEDFEKLTNPTIHWIRIDEDNLIETEELFIEIIEPDMNYAPVNSKTFPFVRTFSIEKELWEQAKVKANHKKLSMSTIIRALLKMWLAGKIEITF